VILAGELFMTNAEVLSLVIIAEMVKKGLQMSGKMDRDRGG